MEKARDIHTGFRPLLLLLLLHQFFKVVKLVIDSICSMLFSVHSKVILYKSFSEFIYIREMHIMHMFYFEKISAGLFKLTLVQPVQGYGREEEWYEGTIVLLRKTYAKTKVF